MKKYITLAASVLLSLSLAACSGNGLEASGQNNTAVNVSDETTGEQEKKVIVGEVSEVIGNLIVLKMFEMPEGYAEMLTRSADMMANRGAGAQGVTRVQNEDGTFSLQNANGEPITMGNFDPNNLPEGMTLPEGATFNGNFDPNNMPERNRGEAGATQERVYTGEEIDVIIPVGIPVTTTTFGENGVEQTEMKLENVKAGSLLVVTYAEDGETVAAAQVSDTSNRRINGGGVRPGGTMPGGNQGFMIDNASGQGVTFTIE